MYTELGEQAVHVILHGRQLDAEAACNHFVRQPFLQEPQDLRFTRSERDAGRGARALVRDGRDVTKQKAGDPR